MSLFNPTDILNAPLPEANETKRVPLPIGETYGQVTKHEFVSGEKDGKAWYKLNVTFEITDQDYLRPVNRDKATMVYGIMLEMNEGGGIATGTNKNVNFGKYREATGTNVVGATLNAAVGKMCRLSIGHRPDKNDPSIVYDEIKAVAKY